MSQAIESDGVVWATANMIPVDSEIFQFPVGWLTIHTEPPTNAHASIKHWQEENACVIVATSVAATSLTTLQKMQSQGFVCIDLALTMTLMNVKRRPRILRPGTVRLAGPEDFAGIESIASDSFDFGRYHRDARFPRSLANRRFAKWISKSLQAPKPGMRFYTMGPPGDPTAFMFVETDGARAQWHLGGVSRTASNGLLGPMLFAGVLEALETEGIRSVTAKISAANTAVLNIYSALGFHAGQSEFTLHRHLNPSSHLLDLIE